MAHNKKIQRMQQMNKWKVAFFVMLTTLILSNGFWVCSAIDSGISYTYQQASLDDIGEANKFLGELIVKGGKEYNQKDILHLIRQSYPNAFIVEEDNLIKINYVTFEFKNNKLVGVN